MISYSPPYSSEEEEQLPEEQLTTSIGKKPSTIQMLPRNDLFSIKQSEMFSATTFRMKTVTCDNKDFPWFNSRIKYLLQDRNKLYKDFRSYLINHLQEQLNFLISRSKQNYYARMTKKLTNVGKNCKAYWSLLRRLLNNKKITSNSTFVS